MTNPDTKPTPAAGSGEIRKILQNRRDFWHKRFMQASQGEHGGCTQEVEAYDLALSLAARCAELLEANVDLWDENKTLKRRFTAQSKARLPEEASGLREDLILVPKAWAEAAICPECDGRGFNVRQPAAGEFEQVQCQWCFERYEYGAAAPRPGQEGKPSDGWISVESAPLAVWGLVWHPAWRRAFPGMRNGDNGAVWIDTCETDAKGRQDYATHWQPLLPSPPKP